MPLTVEATHREFEDLERTAQKLQARKIAVTVPKPMEPLDPGLLQLLGQTLQSTLTKLTGGQLPPLELSPPVGGEVPPELAAAVVGLERAVAAAGARDPKVDKHGFNAADKLQSNAGLQDLIGIVGMIGEDPALRVQTPTS